MRSSAFSCVWLEWLCSKADTEAKNLDGKTALEVAELNKQDGVVDLLKKGTADAKAAAADK